MSTETNRDEYNGWTNRETWAVALLINNDQGMQELAHDAIRSAATTDAADAGGALANWIDGLWLDMLDEPDMRSRDLLVFFGEIGSLWRVDWTALGATFLADVQEIDGE